MKLWRVAELILAHLERMQGAPENRYDRTYYDVEGRHCRGRVVWEPDVWVSDNGKGVTVAYAPFRDAGKYLSSERARRYLVWLDAGGAAPHWVWEDDQAAAFETRCDESPPAEASGR